MVVLLSVAMSLEGGKRWGEESEVGRKEKKQELRAFFFSSLWHGVLNGHVAHFSSKRRSCFLFRRV
jgi:hypothetical protein